MIKFLETFKSFNPITVDTYIRNKKKILLSTFVVEVEIIDIILVIVTESTGVDWVTLYVWISKVLGSFADSILSEAPDTFVVNMTLLLFMLDVTATELEVNIESLELEINAGDGLEV